MLINSEPIVKVIASSTHNGSKLITFELEFWRPLLPQLNTHRVFSRCYSSSRAQGVLRILDSVEKSPWGPKHWTLDQKGMVGGEELNNKEDLERLWKNLACGVAAMARPLSTSFNLHKQIVNRAVEPFMSIKGVLTTDNLTNFFNLRRAKEAQPEMQDLANAMYKAYHQADYRELKLGEWHLPYISEEERGKYSTEILTKLSAARCARVSYNSHNKFTMEEDVALYDRLVQSQHFSPLEMVCQCSDAYIPSNLNAPWVQLRKYEESKIDPFAYERSSIQTDDGSSNQEG